MSKFRFMKMLLPAAVLSLSLGVAVDAQSATKKSSVKVTGPTSNKLGKPFQYTVSGFAVSPANFVTVREASTKCASTYNVEFFQSASTGDSKKVTAGKSFSFKAPFFAVNPGSHYVCVYLINFRTTKTYAHASIRFTNHK